MATKTTKTVKKTVKAKKNTKKTYVAIVLDRSGSMGGLVKETVAGLNEQFAALRRDADLGGETEVTLVQFDDRIDIVLDGQPAKELVNWTDNDFQPRGMTAMYDAIWTAITNLKSKHETEDTGFLVCVISDGHENSSREITQPALSAEIKRLQDSGKWTFTYMLANQDIHQAAATFGANINNVSSWTATSAGAGVAYTSNSIGAASYLNARSAGSKSVSNFYAAAGSGGITNTVANSDPNSTVTLLNTSTNPQGK